MSSLKILLLLGSGKNIGQHVAKGFQEAGYKVAVVSRSVEDGTITSDGFLNIKRDLTDTTSIPSIFDAVKKKFGGAPTVVVYNAATVTQATDENNMFSVPVEGLISDNALNNISAFVAAGEAVTGFETLDAKTPKAFIYTGALFAGKALPIPLWASLGITKSAASYWVGSASEIYKNKGYKFFYADERKESGYGVTMDELSGPGAAEFYLKLAEEDLDIPWHATFVSGQGYVHFPESSRH